MGLFDRLFKKHPSVSFSISRTPRTTRDPEAIEAFRQRQRVARAAVVRRSEVVEAEGDHELPTYEHKARDSRCIAMPVYTETGDILRADLLPDAEQDQPPPGWTTADWERLVNSGEVEQIRELPPTWTRTRASSEIRASEQTSGEREEQRAQYIDRSGCA